MNVRVSFALDFMDFERLFHVFSIANGKNDGMTVVRQNVDLPQTENSKGWVIGRWKPAKQVQNVHDVIR